MLDAGLLADLVAEARLAPSVHNIQPTRWALRDPTTILLLGDPDRRLPAADPNGRDVALSHGAALEGMMLALGARGLAGVRGQGPAGDTGRLRTIASIEVAPGAVDDAYGKAVKNRATWRGGFLGSADEARRVGGSLAADDLVVVTDPASISRIATLGDEAGLFFLRDEDHRRELRHWMRLSRAHPLWARDGLNAEAMALGRMERIAAGLILGSWFRPLDRLGLAAPLLSERAKTRSAAAILLFHRPIGEDNIESGRAFYRRWLAVEAAGLAACPISVLADLPQANRRLAADHLVPDGRQLISVFRAGVAPSRPNGGRARLPVGELIL